MIDRSRLPGAERDPRRAGSGWSSAHRTPFPPPHAANLAGPAGPLAVTVVVTDRARREHWSARLRTLPAVQCLRLADTVQELPPPGGHGPQLTIVDASAGAHPDAPGTLISELRRSGHRRIVVVGTADDVDAIRCTLEAGSRAFLFSRPDPASGDDPPGDAGSGPDSGAVVAQRTRNGFRVPTATGTLCELSIREAEVLRCAAGGKTNRDIASALGLSPFTVKSHMSRIGRRLGTGDRAYMVLLAMRAGAVR